MKRVFLFVLTLLDAGAVAQPAAGQQPTAFIPVGYDTLPGGRTRGDLNHDGRPDLALVLRPAAEAQPDYDGSTMPGRILLVLFGTERGYTLAERAHHALLPLDGGGQYGDPFAEVRICKGVLTVNHYGGSSWRWNVVSKFRYQQGHFFLIGEKVALTRGNGDCLHLAGSPGGSYQETNFVTGEYEIRKISEACQERGRRRGRRAPGPLRRLTDYVPKPEQAGAARVQ